MWKSNEKAPILEYIVFVIIISVLSRIIGALFETSYTMGLDGGKITIGFIIYAFNGMFIDTPGPMLAMIIVLIRHKQLKSVKEFFGLVLHTPKRKKTILILAFFCGMALLTAILFGTRNDSSWYLIIPALPLMILGGGVEEIGWRGFLQPALEKRFSFPIATLIVSAIWITWHLYLWLIPSSNHYGDSIIGFCIWFTVWSFIGAAIYKATKSVVACVIYHAFINAIGAIYDWNQLFDAFPNQPGVYVYFVIALVAAVVLWRHSDKND